MDFNVVFDKKMTKNLPGSSKTCQGLDKPRPKELRPYNDWRQSTDRSKHSRTQTEGWRCHAYGVRQWIFVLNLFKHAANSYLNLPYSGCSNGVRIWRTFSWCSNFKFPRFKGGMFANFFTLNYVCQLCQRMAKYAISFKGPHRGGSQRQEPQKNFF